MGTLKDRLASTANNQDNSHEVVKVENLKKLLGSTSIKRRFNELLGKKAPGFISSLLNVVNSNPKLQTCNPLTIISAGAIAAALDLPIDPNLGFAYIIPYGNKAQFQMGYKGYIQLALRSGQYRTMNVSEVYEDELEFYNPLTGEVKLTDMKNWKYRDSQQQDKIIGYYAYFQLINGFSKELYMSKKQVEAHARKYSKSYNKSDGLWKTNFDVMAKKTVLKLLLSKYGILSIEMQGAIKTDQGVINRFDSSLENVDVDYPDAVTTIDIDAENAIVEVENNKEEVKQLEQSKQPKQQPAEEVEKPEEPQEAPEEVPPFDVDTGTPVRPLF